MRVRSLLTVLALVVTACSGGATAESDGDDEVRPAPDLGPYRGLGTWVDAFDYGPAFQAFGTQPPVAPESVDDMARLGVRTLFLQAAKDDERSPDLLVDEELVSAILTRAHERGLRVVAWYLPTLGDVDADLRRLRALHELEVDGHRFDGLAVDVEWTRDVPDPEERNRRLVELSRRLRDLVGDEALGAIVFPPVQLEVVNPNLWPSFPWRDLEPYYDVWLPMAYWTLREGDYRDAYRYTEESIRRLRANLGDPDAPVHPIGGIGDDSSPLDYELLHRTVQEHDALGWSVYDFATTSSAGWVHLRAPETGDPAGTDQPGSPSSTS
ncbi:MAG: hypothetical protein M5U14_01095 [Acidimicrobiia bacterium]|nr:hypothetical protein [Acidimicrobiia bacterium]